MLIIPITIPFRIVRVGTDEVAEKEDSLSRRSILVGRGFHAMHGDLVLGRFDLDVMQDDRGENHAGNPHELLAYDDSEQRQPHGILDAVTDNLAVQEILKFVYDDEVGEGDQRHLRRDGERNSHDEGVADEVANDGQQSAKESQHQKHRGVFEMVPNQEKRRHSCVDERDDCPFSGNTSRCPA